MLGNNLKPIPVWQERTEAWVFYLFFSSVMLAFPLIRGEMLLNWDALNHHIYLGWVADLARFDKDFLAAGSQSYQYPYLYWPIYRLYMSSLSGRWVGVIWIALHTLVIPPVYLMARASLRGHTWYDVSMRFFALQLALSSVVLVAYTSVTSNDVLASIPLLWAMAFAIKAFELPSARTDQGLRWACFSGLLAGISVAFKWSNGPVSLALPILWLWAPAYGWRPRMIRVLIAGIATLISCFFTYLPWGWQLAHYMGNPLYPFLGDIVHELHGIWSAIR
jgi:hypothetical protein